MVWALVSIWVHLGSGLKNLATGISKLLHLALEMGPTRAKSQTMDQLVQVGLYGKSSPTLSLTCFHVTNRHSLTKLKNIKKVKHHNVCTKHTPMRIRSTFYKKNS